MKKTLVFLGFAVVLIGSITLGWHLTHRPSSAAKQDYAQVYNAHQSKIATITNHQKLVTYLTSLAIWGQHGEFTQKSLRTASCSVILKSFKLIRRPKLTLLSTGTTLLRLKIFPWFILEPGT